jgi:type VI protein secretion system component Hcp
VRINTAQGVRKMPANETSPLLSFAHLTHFDALALSSSDDMLMQIVPKRTNVAIKGEGRTRGDWEAPLQIHGWRWAQGYDTCMPGESQNTRDMRVMDLSIVKAIDAASPAIAKLCAQAELLAHVEIKCFKAAGTDNGVQMEYVSLKLEDALVRNHHLFTSAQLRRTCEAFDISAKKITLTCAPQKENGARGPEVTFALDVTTRKVQ